MYLRRLSASMVDPTQALPGRAHPIHTAPERHAVLGTPLEGPWPKGSAVLYLALGCFWGAERAFWTLPGVVTTAVGYQGGFTPNPTYEEVCTGLTGHAETVRVVYDPQVTDAASLLRVFWESHDPTQGFRQGNDHGTQYRSAVFWTTADQEQAYRATRAAYQGELHARGFGDITTEGRPTDDAEPFFLAEEYHQQYLHKVPHGYCPDHGTGVSCPVGLGVRATEE